MIFAHDRFAICRSGCSSTKGLEFLSSVFTINPIASPASIKLSLCCCTSIAIDTRYSLRSYPVSPSVPLAPPVLVLWVQPLLSVPWRPWSPTTQSRGTSMLKTSLLCGAVNPSRFHRRSSSLLLVLVMLPLFRRSTSHTC